MLPYPKSTDLSWLCVSSQNSNNAWEYQRNAAHILWYKPFLGWFIKLPVSLSGCHDIPEKHWWRQQVLVRKYEPHYSVFPSFGNIYTLSERLVFTVSQNGQSQPKPQQSAITFLQEEKKNKQKNRDSVFQVQVANRVLWVC